MAPTQGRGARPETPEDNQRRSPRISARIPLYLAFGHGKAVAATTISINRHGGLILSPVEVRPQRPIWIQNRLRRGWVKANVVRVQPQDLKGGFYIAVEFAGEADTCWSEEYEKGLGGTTT